MVWTKEAFEKMKCDANGTKTTIVVELYDINCSNITVVGELLEEIMESITSEAGLNKLEFMDLKIKHDIENYHLELLAKKAFNVEELSILDLLKTTQHNRSALVEMATSICSTS